MPLCFGGEGPIGSGEAEAGVDRKERPLRLDDLGFGEGRPKTRGGVSVSPSRKISGQS